MVLRPASAPTQTSMAAGETSAKSHGGKKWRSTASLMPAAFSVRFRLPLNAAQSPHQAAPYQSRRTAHSNGKVVSESSRLMRSEAADERKGGRRRAEGKDKRGRKGGGRCVRARAFEVRGGEA